MFSLYASPSIFAITTKILICVIGWRSFKYSSHWMKGYFASFFIANIIELSGFAYYIHHPDQALIPLKIYYISLLWAGLFLLLLSVSVTDYIKSKKAISLFTVPCLTVSVLIFIPDLVIAGVGSIGYSLTRVPGVIYAVAPLTIVGYFIASLSILAVVAKKTKNRETECFCISLLASVLSTIVTIVFIALLMSLSAKVNASIFLPVAINISLLIMLYCENSDRRFELLSKIPGTQESKFAKSTKEIYLGSRNLKEAIYKMELALICDTLDMYNDDKDQAAMVLGISTQTLDRRLKKRK